jgi:competence protein ComFC
LEVHTFFEYTALEPLLLSKHKPEGWRIYRWLGKTILRPFFETFGKHIDSDVTVIGIDERPKGGYAHIAAMTHMLKGIKHLHIKHAALIAQNEVRYAGKPLQYRITHPRRFDYSGPSEGDVILIDDIVTTGTTLQEAYRTVTQAGAEVLFAVTLADAERHSGLSSLSKKAKIPSCETFSSSASTEAS